MKNFIKKLDASSFLTTIMMLVIGVLLTFIPAESIKIMTLVIGYLVIGFGIYLIVSYFITKDTKISLLLIFGILCVLMGGYLVINNAALATFAITLIGVVILVKACLKIQFAAFANSVYSLWVGIVQLLIGIILLVRPFDSIVLFLRIIGICLLVSSVLELVGNHLTKDTKKEEKTDKEEKDTKNDDAKELDYVEKK